MDFDILAEKYPVLHDLMGIASQMIYSDSITRKVVLNYIASILKHLDIPTSVLKDFSEVMYLEVMA